MKTYARIAGEGLSLILTPLLAAFYVLLLFSALPFFLLGLVKRGFVAAFTAGDPLVP